MFKKVIRNLKHRKVAGYDRIEAELLKRIRKRVTETHLEVFNKALIE